ncbi:MAG TPA: pyridoxamine 5'-phosphate oxidase family protein [Acidimicrobiales bacterium]|nr:pyridoxamine 5'-phosphate oxidase family protein [Acidimicrobiales bacterium]
MGRTYAAIDDRLASFLQAQPVFFVASAPLSGEGLVNCSPKSNNGELTVIDPQHVAYLDRTGSGVETIAHLRENGRIVLMFCAFQGPPRIVRIHGHGTVVARDDEDFVHLSGRFTTDRLQGTRSVIVVSAERIADSCGYGVPLMDLRSHRRQLAEWVDRKGDEGIREYWESTNSKSLDDLPAL